MLSESDEPRPSRSSGSSALLHRLTSVGLRWWLAGWVNAGRPDLLSGHVRGGLQRHRRSAAQPDRHRDRRRSGEIWFMRSPPRRLAPPVRSAPQPRVTSAVGRSVRVQASCSRSCLAGPSPPTDPSCSHTERPIMGRRPPSRIRRIRLAEQLKLPRPGIGADPPRRRAAAVTGAKRQAARRTAGDGRRWTAARKRRARSARRCALLHPRRDHHAGGRHDRLFPGGYPLLPSAAPHGRRRSQGGRRRPYTRAFTIPAAPPTRCVYWQMPSTTCSTASPRPSLANARLSPTPRTSCARR